MKPDWNRLGPNRPLAAEDAAEYVESPTAASLRIAKLIEAGSSPLLVAGPVGVGKSTELARAAFLLVSSRPACVVALDRHENMRRITAGQALLRIAGEVVRFGIEVLEALLSTPLVEDLVTAKVLSAKFSTRSPLDGADTRLTREPRDLAVSALREVSKWGTEHRIAILVDGLEKTPEQTARPVLDALADLTGEADIVVVVPAHCVYGPMSDTVIAAGEKAVFLRPVGFNADPNLPSPCLPWFREMVARRLQLGIEDLLRAPADFSDVVTRCAWLSGGLPRTFLQLLADAATYARLHREADWPAQVDLYDAEMDLRDSFRRLLLPGDIDAIRNVEGTDGLEMDLARKLRLLSHGILLELEEQELPVMRTNPLVRHLVQPIQHA